MNIVEKTIALLVCAFSLLCLQECSHERHGIEGHWKLLPEKSSSIDPWSTLTLDVYAVEDAFRIVSTYSAGNPYDTRTDSVIVNTQGKEQVMQIPPGRWLGGVSMGVYYGTESVRQVTARWSEDGSELNVETRETLETSQGEIETTSRQTFSSSPDGSTLTITETRSTRSSQSPMKYTFVRVTK